MYVTSHRGSLSFPAGSAVTVDDYGNGGVLTPYDGENKPPGSLCDPAVYTDAHAMTLCLQAGGHEALPSQLKELEELIMESHGRKPDAVLMTIGANDVAWTKFVQRCYPEIAKLGGLSEAIGDECLKPKYTNPIEARLGGLPSRYGKLASAFKTAGIEASTVFLTDYWDATRDGGHFESPYSPWCPNEHLGLIAPSPKAREWGHDHLVVPLNERVANAALAYHWNLIGGIGTAFDGHGVCSTPELSWITSALQSQESEGNTNGPGTQMTPVSVPLETSSSIVSGSNCLGNL